MSTKKNRSLTFGVLTRDSEFSKDAHVKVTPGWPKDQQRFRFRQDLIHFGQKSSD